MTLSSNFSIDPQVILIFLPTSLCHEVIDESLVALIEMSDFFRSEGRSENREIAAKPMSGVTALTVGIPSTLSPGNSKRLPDESIA